MANVDVYVDFDLGGGKLQSFIVEYDVSRESFMYSLQHVLGTFLPFIVDYFCHE